MSLGKKTRILRTWTRPTGEGRGAQFAETLEEIVGLYDDEGSDVEYFHLSRLADRVVLNRQIQNRAAANERELTEIADKISVLCARRDLILGRGDDEAD